MSSKKLKILQHLSYLAFGGVLCYFFLKNVNLKEILNDLKNRNYNWFYAVLTVSLIVYIIRTLRWKMLVESNQNKVNFIDLFSALSMGYFVNLVIPRLGEVTRCFSIKKQYKIDFTELLGTVIIERITDILSLFLFLLLTVIIEFRHILNFTIENIYIPISNNIKGKAYLFLIVLIAMLAATIFIYIKRDLLRKKTPSFVAKIINGFKQGLTSISILRQKKLFILYTILIWVGYYFMTYFWFFVFEEQNFLSAGVCLSIVAIGTIGRSIPIQGGGMGAYHFLVAGIIMIYGGSEDFGKSLAILIHGGQTLFTFLTGIAGILLSYRMKE